MIVTLVDSERNERVRTVGLTRGAVTVWKRVVSGPRPLTIVASVAHVESTVARLQVALDLHDARSPQRLILHATDGTDSCANATADLHPTVLSWMFVAAFNGSDFVDRDAATRTNARFDFHGDSSTSRCVSGQGAGENGCCAGTGWSSWVGWRCAAPTASEADGRTRSHTLGLTSRARARRRRSADRPSGVMGLRPPN